MPIDLSRLYDPDHGPADAPPGEPFDAWRLAVLTPEQAAALSLEARLAYFAGWALLAPTTHNTVPQRFELRPDEKSIRFWIDRARVLPESDPEGRQATVSLGCAIENAVLAAAVVGFTAEIDWVADAAVLPGSGAEERVHVATVRFVREGTPAQDIDWLAAMRRRKMVRAEFDERVRLAPELAEELRGRVTALHAGLTLHLLTDAPTRMFLGKFQELADSTVINRERFARELGAWLLPNDSAAAAGMRGREFGLADETAARMHRGLLGEQRLLPDETAGFAKSGNLGMRSASAAAVITAARDDLEHRLAAGRAFEQLALLLTNKEHAVAMHAGITEVEAPNMALRGRLRTRQRPTVVFRIGKPLHPEDAQRPHAARPPLQELLVTRGSAQ